MAKRKKQEGKSSTLSFRVFFADSQQVMSPERDWCRLDVTGSFGYIWIILLNKGTTWIACLGPTPLTWICKLFYNCFQGPFCGHFISFYQIQHLLISGLHVAEAVALEVVGRRILNNSPIFTAFRCQVVVEVGEEEVLRMALQMTDVERWRKIKKAKRNQIGRLRNLMERCLRSQRK